MADPYRLIWFQHFHKAAGSSIVQLAEKNGEKLYPRHGNGNPLDAKGNVIPLWELPPGDLTAFVNKCERDGVSFVTTEWGAPDLSTLIADVRVELITCLREPMARFVSNYNYDYHAGYTDCETLEEYVSSYRSFTMPDYYCRTLARIDARPDDVTEAEYRRACEAMAGFDVCEVMEQSGFLQRMCASLGWECKESHRNRSGMSLRRYLGPIILCRPKLLWRRLRRKRVEANAVFAAAFRKRNQWDLALYAAAGKAEG